MRFIRNVIISQIFSSEKYSINKTLFWQAIQIYKSDIDLQITSERSCSELCKENISIYIIQKYDEQQTRVRTQTDIHRKEKRDT